MQMASARFHCDHRPLGQACFWCLVNSGFDLDDLEELSNVIYSDKKVWQNFLRYLKKQPPRFALDDKIIAGEISKMWKEFFVITDDVDESRLQEEFGIPLQKMWSGRVVRKRAL